VKRTLTILAAMAGLSLVLPVGVAQAKNAQAKTSAAFKPTVEDWISVNAAVNNYTLGLELHDSTRFDAAFWPEATITAVPEPGKSFTMPYAMAGKGPPPPPPGSPPMLNVIGNDIAPWHLSLSHDFVFESPTRARHYGYFISVYPDLKTKTTTVGLPGHYDDVLEKRNGEWRILQRKTVIGTK